MNENVKFTNNDRIHFSLYSLLHRYNYPLILLVILAVLYLPTLSHPFVWDDVTLIENNPHLKNLKNLPDALQMGYLQNLTGDTHIIPFYRPASVAVLFFEYYLFGNNVSAFRVLHYSVHVVSVILLFFFLRRLFARDLSIDGNNDFGNAKINNAKINNAEINNAKINNAKIAFAGALFFSCTPYSVDAVVFLTNIGDILVLCSMLASLLLHEDFVRQKKYTAFASSLFFSTLAIFSKETGVLTPVVILIFNLYDPRLYKCNRAYYLSACTIPILFVYFFLRTNALQSTIGIDLVASLKNFPVDCFKALRWTLFPHPLSLMKHINMISYSAYLWIPTGLLFVATIFLTKRHRIPLIGVLLWLTTVSPSIAASYLVHFFSPRYLYVPSVGAAIIFSYIFYRVSVQLRYALLAVPLLLFLLAFIRADVWKSNLSLWNTEVELQPKNALALLNLGTEMNQLGETDKAMALFFQARDAAKEKKQRVMEGLVLQKIGWFQLVKYNDPVGAKSAFLKSLYRHPTHQTWSFLGRIYAEHDRNYSKAYDAFLHANRLKANQFEILTNIAGALGGLNRFDEAYQYLNQAQKLANKDTERLKSLRERRASIRKYEQLLTSTEKH